MGTGKRNNNPLPPLHWMLQLDMKVGRGGGGGPTFLTTIAITCICIPHALSIFAELSLLPTHYQTIGSKHSDIHVGAYFLYMYIKQHAI